MVRADNTAFHTNRHLTYGQGGFLPSQSTGFSLHYSANRLPCFGACIQPHVYINIVEL